MNERTEWNHTPELPIAVSPLWQWPPQPLRVLKWYADGWFFLTINMETANAIGLNVEDSILSRAKILYR